MIYHKIRAESLNDIVYSAIKEIMNSGIKMNTRNGEARALYNVDLILTNPRARHLCLRGRTNNIFGTLGEMFWVMAGQKEISPHLEFFVPRAKNYSDDGITWNASYGDRLWNYGQFDHIFKMFEEDGLYTRRATQSIFVPGHDTYKEYKERGGTMKDIPCNQCINYFVIPEGETNKLYMKVCQRSGDIIFGTGNINIPEFTLMQEMVLSVLKEMYPDENLELRDYIQSVSNLHLYDMTLKQGVDILNQTQIDLIADSKKDNLEIKLPSSRDIFSGFSALYDFQVRKIQGKNVLSDSAKIEFGNSGFNAEDNLLFFYFQLVDWYITATKAGYDKNNKMILDESDRATLKEIAIKTPGLYNSVVNSGFRNFEI